MMNPRDNRRGPPAAERRSAPPGERPEGPPAELVPEVLSGKGERIVYWAQKLASMLEDLKRSQIRNFYGPLIRLRETTMDAPEEAISRLHLMRARLHYMANRERAAIPLRDVFERLIPALDNRQKLMALYDFAEALVSYHRERSQRD